MINEPFAYVVRWRPGSTWVGTEAPELLKDLYAQRQIVRMSDGWFPPEYQFFGSRLFATSDEADLCLTALRKPWYKDPENPLFFVAGAPQYHVEHLGLAEALKLSPDDRSAWFDVVFGGFDLDRLGDQVHELYTDIFGIVGEGSDNYEEVNAELGTKAVLHFELALQALVTARAQLRLAACEATDNWVKRANERLAIDNSK